MGKISRKQVAETSTISNSTFRNKLKQNKQEKKKNGTKTTKNIRTTR